TSCDYAASYLTSASGPAPETETSPSVRVRNALREGNAERLGGSSSGRQCDELASQAARFDAPMPAVTPQSDLGHGASPQRLVVAPAELISCHPARRQGRTAK